MIKWIKLDAGEYESEDKRFYILKSWDRLYGNHWVLRDKNNSNNSNPYKGKYDLNTLKQCKEVAENILCREVK